ncbi:MAG: class I SAM-dependent methyltransferase [Streptosporangiaceae bacterium]|jgi:SAM-dependent methyltransferase
MPSDFQWDETLYAGSAPYYATGRLPYPAALAQAVGSGLSLDGSGRLLDVGCGPGSLTLLLAPLVAEAVGIDADAGMIAQAADQAKRAARRNVSWRRMRAEELPGALGRFRVVTFAQSFHWLDQQATAAAVRAMLEPGGACVHVHATTHEGATGGSPMPHPRPPRARIAALVGDYLGPVRRAGRNFLPAGPPAEGDKAMAAAGFAGPERVTVLAEVVHERTADQVVASVFSLSSAAPHLFGDRLAEFESQLRRLLRSVSPGGLFCERQRQIAVDIWRS